jgi:uncharacterized hydrophobic protein (TIGR00271 family)
VIHLRLIVEPALTAAVLDELQSAAGVAHIVHVDGARSTPPGELILCDVAREAANDLVERLQRLGVHKGGAIALSDAHTIVSDAAARADDRAPGIGADAIIWEGLEARARDESQLSVSFLVFMSIASIVAAVGILLDAPILIVGAMVLGPEYGPLAALCIAAARRRWRHVARAAVTLGVGLAVAMAVTLLASLVFRATGIAPERYDLDDRQLTAFISHPDAMAAVVAVLAGIAGMLSLTTARSDALIGVLVSVTTIPAVANAAVAAAYRQWGEVGGATSQLAINLGGLIVAGVATLWVQGRRYRARM